MRREVVLRITTLVLVASEAATWAAEGGGGPAGRMKQSLPVREVQRALAEYVRDSNETRGDYGPIHRRFGEDLGRLLGVTAFPCKTKHNLLSEAREPVLSGGTWEGHNVLSHSRKARIFRALVIGHNALSSAYRPEVEDSVVVGHNVLSGAPREWQRDPFWEPLIAPQIRGSVVFGWNALSNAEGGLIEGSVVAGYGPLDGAELVLRDSVIVTPKATIWIPRELRLGGAITVDDLVSGKVAVPDVYVEH